MVFLNERRSCIAKRWNKNLKPLNKRTKEEQREIQSKGGVNSGKARRKKADLKKAMELLMTLDVQDGKQKDA
ncbi:hypothetical protein Javan386_0025 [Streptococcus phage Javan386]|nr:hypothetical protein Javan386_0025 [Streptococcus phage Javan386]